MCKAKIADRKNRGDQQNTPVLGYGPVDVTVKDGPYSPAHTAARTAVVDTKYLEDPFDPQGAE